MKPIPTLIAVLLLAPLAALHAEEPFAINGIIQQSPDQRLFPP